MSGHSSLYQGNEPLSEEEMFLLFCALSQTEWDEKHTPLAMKVYTQNRVYTFFPSEKEYRLTEE